MSAQMIAMKAVSDSMDPMISNGTTFLVQKIIVSFVSTTMIQNVAIQKKINLSVLMEPFTTSPIQQVILKKHPPLVIKIADH